MASAWCSPTGRVVEKVVARDFFDVFANEPVAYSAECLVAELGANFLIAERPRGDGFVGGCIDALLLGYPRLVSGGEAADVKRVFFATHDDDHTFPLGFNILRLKCAFAICAGPSASMDGHRK